MVPRLLEAISTAETNHPDDAFIARTCLAQIHWIQEAPTDALNALPSATATTSKSEIGGSATLGWLEVCEVKAAYIRASCLEASGRPSDAKESYQAAVSRTPGYRTPELRQWTERLLGRACMYTVKRSPTPSIQDLSETYYSFKAWGDYWQRAPASTGSTTSASRLDVPRRAVWKAYHDLLSTVLQHDLLYSPYASPGADAFVFSNTIIPDEQRATMKQRQRAEMQHVETVYETLLLEETKFPKADQSNGEVEEWTAQVVANWRQFTGPDWSDFDVGEGGRSAVSRVTLDILYRASAKTFHSTAILRQLFTVHAALGEFDLAMHAFDSYMEIVDKAKARASKTGKHELGSDNDDIAMLTAADAIRLLCRYGDRDQAEKANEIANAMSRWLAQQRPPTGEAPHTNGDTSENVHPASQPGDTPLRPETLAAAYRSIGICKAHWAHLTYDSAERSSMFSEATENLRIAQRLEPRSIGTAHALALVLASARDVPGAIEVIRGALTGSVMLNGDAASQQNHERERRLLSLWHLLALCLSAQDKHDTAAQICEAAYKQFGNSQLLFGQTAKHDSLNPEMIAVSTASPSGFVAQTEGFERESILQIRMSQVLLVELMEGPDAAIDMTDSLLGLYSRLFGNPEHVTISVSRPPQTAATAATSRFGGTLRSITGSIRPRSAVSRRSSNAEKNTLRKRSVNSADGTLRPATNGQGTTAPIAITITNEDGNPAEKKHHSHHLHLPFHKHQSTSPSARTSAVSVDGADENLQPSETTATPGSTASSSNGTPGQPLPEIAHNASHDTFLPPPAGHPDQPPVQDVRLPAPHPAASMTVPESHLSPIHERRHKVGVLIKTWLFVAGLYVRADSCDDAQSAVDHASKLVESLEVEFAASPDGVNARRLYEKGWGGSKSIDELWADVWSTVSGARFTDPSQFTNRSQKALLAATRQQPFEAIAAFEQALSYYPDHSAGIIGLSDLLLDIYEQKIPAEEPLPSTQPPLPSTSGSLISEAKPSLTRPNTASSTEPSHGPSLVNDNHTEHTGARKKDPSPAELNRLAARDRAYMLLSTLTKLGTGWDDSEAWSMLARAHELSREIDKAKQALWWVVELEDSRPLRGWGEISPGGYTL